MKTKTYKRNLSVDAIRRMRAGGRNATFQQKSKAGKLGWPAMIRSVISKKLV